MTSRHRLIDQRYFRNAPLATFAFMGLLTVACSSADTQQAEPAAASKVVETRLGIGALPEFVQPLLTFEPLYIEALGDPTLIASNGGGDALSLVYDSDEYGLFVINQTHEVEPGDAQRVIDVSVAYHTKFREVAYRLDEKGDVLGGAYADLEEPPDIRTNVIVVESVRGDAVMYEGEYLGGSHAWVLSIEGVSVDVIGLTKDQTTEQAFEVLALLLAARRS